MSFSTIIRKEREERGERERSGWRRVVETSRGKGLGSRIFSSNIGSRSSSSDQCTTEPTARSGARVLFISCECMDYGPTTLHPSFSLGSIVTLKDSRIPRSLPVSRSIPCFHLSILQLPSQELSRLFFQLRGSQSCFLSILENRRRDLKSKKRASVSFPVFLFVFFSSVLPTSAEGPIFRAIRACPTIRTELSQDSP